MKTSVKYREIWIIAYPIIIGSVAQNLLNITDTAFLGRVGQVALGAGAIGGIFYLINVMLTWGFGIGTQIIIARRNGERAFSEIGRTFQHGFYFQLPLALTLFSLMQFFSGDIMKYIIQSDAVYESTREYIRFRSYGIFFASINMLFRGFYIGITRTKIITWTTILMASVNAVLDYGLIFGHFGLPEMGIGGAALASSISECSATIFFAIFTFFRLDAKKYNFFHLARFDDSLYRRIIRVALPMMMQNFVSMAAWLAFFLFIEKLGEQALAVSNIVRSFYVILMMPMWGFSSATNALVSTLIGQGKEQEVLSLILKVVRLCSLMVFIIVTLGIIFPELALRIYTIDPVIIAASLPAMYVVNLAAMLHAIAFVFFSGVSGTGKTQVAFFIEFLVIIVYLGIAFILADVMRTQVYIVWMSEYFYALMLGIISYIYLASGRWKSTRI